MKKALKIIVPIVLGLAIIVSAVWYFIQYDRGFTQDILIACARKAEDNGNRSLSAFFYNWAYRQSDEDETVAIELAEQYKLAGNYTKAEYTLSNAISDGGSAELYTALCKTYVEQDKLLDAVTMLDNIADPQIKAELDARRPKAPVASHEQGFYSEYFELAITSEIGDVFVSTSKDYPSLENEPLTKAMTLPSGETVIQALAVDESGLVSPLSVFSYTITGVIEEVSISDPAMDAAIREILQVSSDHVFYSNELWSVTELEIPTEAKNLDDLSKLSFLEKLTISEASFDSYAPLSSLNSLAELVILNTALTPEDVKIISTLPKLTHLTLVGCGLSGIQDLSACSGLVYLDMNNNAVKDLSPLADLRSLNYLNMSHNAISDLSALKDLTKLDWLDVSYNTITSTAPLAACSAMTRLYIQNNSLTALEGVGNLANLTHLYAANNQIADVSPLRDNINLTELDISYNAVTDITQLDTLKLLQNFNFAHNQVTALPAFPKDSHLVLIDGTENQLSSIDALGGLPQLNKVYMDYNAGITSVDALAQCRKLLEVRVLATSVANVDKLKELGVVVAYAPVTLPTEETA